MKDFRALTGAAMDRVKVVDIGANPIDSEPPYAGMLRTGAVEVVGFEPNPLALAALEARMSAISRMRSAMGGATPCTSARRRA